MTARIKLWVQCPKRVTMRTRCSGYGLVVALGLLVLGGGGLVSTLRDFVRFAEALRAGGILDWKRILSPKTIN